MIVVHCADGLACPFEQTDHLLFREMCAIDNVGVYGVLKVTCLYYTCEDKGIS